MRIAYVALHLQEVIMKGGVGHKVAAQLNIWQELGHECHFFLHTPDTVEYPNTTIFPYKGKGSPAPVRVLSRELNRSRALSRMLDSIRDYHPDVIYLRYGMYWPPLEKLFDIAPVAVEINGDDVNEYRYRGSIYYHTNRLTRTISLGRSSGLVHTSREISQLESNTRLHKPSIVIANGIDLRQYDELPAPHNETPRLSLVCSAGYNWHGVDKMLWLAQRFPDLTFDVIGHNMGEGAGNLPNVNFHGFLLKDQVKEILKNSDVSLGTLALHRKQMEEASPLKVREALAYGIPTVLTYEDTDLTGHDFDFILTIPNHEENVAQHAEQIRDFAYRMAGKRAERSLVAPLIDQVNKERSRLEFFEKLANRNG